MSSYVILLSSGRGVRSSLSVPKQFIKLIDHPVIYYSIKTLIECDFINKIIIVVLESYVNTINSILEAYELKDNIDIVIGSDARQKSILNAYHHLQKYTIDDNSRIIVMDCVRPLVLPNTFKNMNDLMDTYDVVGAYTDCTATILVNKNNSMTERLVRSTLSESHTPQYFKYSIFKTMYSEINEYELEEETECLQLALKYTKINPHLYKISKDESLKITYKSDIGIVENIISNINKKVILITGGSKGIGKEIAKKLSSIDRYIIIICARNESVLMEVANNLDIDYFVCDISIVDNVKSMIIYIIQKYSRLDILINNASISHVLTDIINIDESVLANIFNVNVLGTFYCCKYSLREMVENNSGVIITICSSGINGGRKGESMYISSKNAVKSLSDSIAVEYKNKNIYSYCVVPRRTDTELRSKMYPDDDKDKLLAPNDIIENILFLITKPPPKLTGSAFWIT